MPLPLPERIMELESLIETQNKEIVRLREENTFLKEQNKGIAELRMRGRFGGGLGRPYL